MSSKSFNEVEKQAQVAEKMREEQAAEAKKQAEESMWVHKEPWETSDIISVKSGVIQVI